MYDPYVREILHIPSEEDTQGSGGNHILALGITTPIDESASDQERIDSVVAQGGIPILAHPNSNDYPFPLDKLLKYRRYKVIEAVNNAMKKLNPLYYWGNSYAFDKWDSLLSSGREIFATAGDDYTPYDGGFDGAAISVFSPSASYADIMANIRQGNFYAVEGSTAPRFEQISIDSTKIEIKTDEMCNVNFIGRAGKTLKTEHFTTTASYEINGGEGYVRVEARSLASGRRSWTQAIFIAPVFNLLSTEGGFRDISLGQAMLSSNTTSSVSAELLQRGDYPEASPPSGYLSPIYKFETASSVNTGTRLSISYADQKLLGSEQSIYIYTYLPAENSWIRVPTTIDYEHKIAYADLEHFSLYALSTEQVPDSEKPEVALLEPADLFNLAGEAAFIASASDNQAVMSVSFYLDHMLIGSDIDDSDGWSVLVDTSLLPRGVYKLLVVAEDVAGNTDEKEYDLSVLSEIEPPLVALDEVGSNLDGVGSIGGSYTSHYAVSDIGIYIGDVFIGSPEYSEGSFSLNIDWDAITEGDYILKVVLRDTHGNYDQVEQAIRIGKKVEAQIVSPQNKAYLRGGIVEVDIKVSPANAEIEIAVDGVAVENNSTLDLLYYSIGTHNVEVRSDGEVIASDVFHVITTFADTKSIVWRLYRGGHIGNFGIATAICARLSFIESQIPLMGLKQLVILEEYVKRHSDQGDTSKVTQFGWEALLDSTKYLSSFLGG